MSIEITSTAESDTPVILQSIQSKTADVHTLVEFLESNQQYFSELLLQHGGLIFRGFGIENIEQFSQVISACNLGEQFIYDNCIVPRHKLATGIYTSINSHPSVDIPIHNEKSYTHNFPRHIYFSCFNAPSTGGCTVLGSAKKIWQALSDPLKEKIYQHGFNCIRYFFSRGLFYNFVKTVNNGFLAGTWMEYYQTNDKSAIEKTIQQLNSKFTWLRNGKDLKVEIHLPGYQVHPITKDEVFFTNATHLNYHQNIFKDAVKNLSLPSFLIYSMLSYLQRLPMVYNFGNDQPLSAKESLELKQVVHSHRIFIPWCEGDFMVLDNLLMKHGKNPHTGKRYVVTAMTS